MGGQLANPPLLDDEEVCTQTIIGSHALKPMVLDHAVYISHMSFGALSKEAKTALAIGSSAVKTAECGGEGGVLRKKKHMLINTSLNTFLINTVLLMKICRPAARLK